MSDKKKKFPDELFKPVESKRRRRPLQGQSFGGTGPSGPAMSGKNGPSGPSGPAMSGKNGPSGPTMNPLKRRKRKNSRDDDLLKQLYG